MGLKNLACSVGGMELALWVLFYFVFAFCFDLARVLRVMHRELCLGRLIGAGEASQRGNATGRSFLRLPNWASSGLPAFLMSLVYWGFSFRRAYLPPLRKVAGEAQGSGEEAWT